MSRRAQIRLAVASLVVTLAALEIGARAFVSRRIAQPPPGRKAYDTVPDRELGYRLRSSTSFRASRLKASGEPCYDVIYTSDAFGRRVVGAPPGAAPNRPRLILFGCSFTLGEGLPDEETLAYRLGERFDVVNYAVHGYGPQQTLALVRGEVLAREVPSHRAIGLHVLYPFHPERTAVGSNHPGLWQAPYFELGDDGVLRAHPTFADAHPLRLFALRAFRLVKDLSALARWLDARSPPFGELRHAELTAAILVEAARRFEARWGGPFVVAVEGRGRNLNGIDVLVERLQAAGVVVIDDRDLERDERSYLCDGDFHPNAAFVAALARRLERHLLRVSAGADDRPARPARNLPPLVRSRAK